LDPVQKLAVALRELQKADTHDRRVPGVEGLDLTTGFHVCDAPEVLDVYSRKSAVDRRGGSAHLGVQHDDRRDG
jgi:hypothetical protein